MPGETEPITQFVNSGAQITYKNLNELGCSNGFLFSPFQGENFPTIVIPNEHKFKGWQLEIEAYPKPLAVDAPMHNIKDDDIVSPDDYSRQIEYLKEHYLHDNSKKIVLSRTKCLKGFDYKQLPEIFELLTQEYKHAFIYLLYTPYSGIWLGATPETLVNTDNENFSTMALAATKEYSANTNDWTKKEILEQEYVVEYLRKKLTEGGYLYNESSRSSSRAGNVMHLQTMFKGLLKNNANEWKQLVDLLYPTPAICGTDNDESLTILRKVEKHSREYYSGIIGPFNAAGKTDLFVNLRSMKVSGCSALLYAGGGILKTSDAQKEWEETDLKFNTLLRVIEQIMGKF